jgi:aspartyl aminopeptidase
LKQGQEYARKILAGLNASPSHFHAVNYCKAQLKEAGFTEIKETEKWKLEAGQSYYFTRNGSTLCAFINGTQCGGEAKALDRFKIIGCHTDSPVLKIAPYSKLQVHGYNQINVMTYGGGLWRTWFDRDLTVAGKVIVKVGEKLESRYWHAERPIMKLPNLAIHLCREEAKMNFETDLKPVIATSVVDSLFCGGAEEISKDTFKIGEKHFATLTDLMAKDIGVKREDIVDFELNVCDSTPAQLVGIHEEFVSSPRLDNLCSSLCALDSLIA